MLTIYVHDSGEVVEEIINCITFNWAERKLEIDFEKAELDRDKSTNDKGTFDIIMEVANSVDCNIIMSNECPNDHGGMALFLDLAVSIENNPDYLRGNI